MIAPITRSRPFRFGYFTMSHRTDKLWQSMLASSFSPSDWYQMDGDELHHREERIMWVYKQLDSGEYAVGYYTPDKEWVEDSRYRLRQDAVRRVHYLNGGTSRGSDGPIDR